MQDIFLAIELASDEAGLLEFSVFLRKAGFPHRITEHKAGLALWVFREDDVSRVKALYRHHQDGVLPELPDRSCISLFDAGRLLRYPLTLSLIVLSIIGFMAVSLEWLALINLLSFQGLVVNGDAVGVVAPELVQQKILEGEFWRLVTPAFLHFDFMHIGFNMAFLWFFANQVERSEGWWLLLVDVLVIATLSNIAQFAMFPGHLFGGMSGVNYGLLAYCVLANFLCRNALYQFPPGLLLFSVVMMLAGFLGLFSLFGYSIANWAHLAGLLAGFAMALLVHGHRLFYSRQ